jgi:hypothetical protein
MTEIEILLVKPEGAGMVAKRGKMEGLLAACTANIFSSDRSSYSDSGLLYVRQAAATF